MTRHPIAAIEKTQECLSTKPLKHSGTREKKILEKLLRSLKIAPFSSLLLSRGEMSAIFELRKKQGFENCSNIHFPLDLRQY